MKVFFAFCLLIFSTISTAHEVVLSSQHVDIKKQNETGWQHEVLGKAVITPKVSAGLQASYLERFDLHENLGGGFLQYKASQRLSLELKHLQGGGNEILPEKQSLLTAYYALYPGYSPFISFSDLRYSATRVNLLRLGIEIEKIRHFIFVPQVMLGKAIFKSPAKTDNIYALGLRAIYYVEKNFSVFAFGSKGEEASQGIIGESSLLVSTLTGGLGGSYHFRPYLKGELVIDHTDYAELRNQFITTTASLVWSF